MDRITCPRTAGYRMTLVLSAGLVSTLSGCGLSTSDEYQTLSPADADRVDRVRRAAREASTAEQEATLAEPADTAPIPAARLAAQRTIEAADVLIIHSPKADTPPEETGDERAFESLLPDSRAADTPTTIPPERQMAAFLSNQAGQTIAGLIRGEPLKRQIRLLVPEQIFAVEGPEDAIRVSYDDLDLLKVLNMDPVPINAVEHFPQWLLDLDGERIRIRGFMYPTFEESGLRGFLLARDNQICCFGRNPKIYDLFPVTMRHGETTDYIQGRPFDVVGVFHIAPDIEGDKLWQLYEIDDAVVLDR